jgi:hypothetical protein
MTFPLASKLGKYKHIILIAVAVTALGAYLLPLSTVFAANNSANQAARDAILKKGHPSNSPSTSITTKTNSNPSSGSGSTGTSSSNPSSSTSITKPGTDTTFSNGNSAQLGGPGDSGNIGRGNTGTGNTGNLNSGNGNTGNLNSGNNNCGNLNSINNNVGNLNKYGGVASGARC